MRADINEFHGAVFFDWTVGMWRWRSGEIEPRLRTFGLEGLIPERRRIRNESGEFVEVPNLMPKPYGHPGVPVAMARLKALIHGYGKRASIHSDRYSRMIGVDGIRVSGFRIPAEHWDAVMKEPVGVQCDDKDLPYIMEKIGEMEGQEGTA